MISFYNYNIKNNRTGESYTIGVRVTYMCEGTGEFNSFKRKILLVNMTNSSNEKTYRLSYDDFKTPDGLIEYTNSAYLFSVNTDEQ